MINFDSIFQTATEYFEKAKETLIDSVGAASEKVLPEYFISDSVAKEILNSFDQIEESCKSNIIKIHMLRQNIVEYSENLLTYGGSFSNHFHYSDNSTLNTMFHDFALKCDEFRTFAKEIADQRIPNEIEQKYDLLQKNVKNVMSNSRNEFTQLCIRSERIKLVINNTLDTAPAERVYEVQRDEEETCSKLNSMKHLLSATANKYKKDLQEIQLQTLKNLETYQKELFEKQKNLFL